MADKKPKDTRSVFQKLRDRTKDLDAVIDAQANPAPRPRSAAGGGLSLEEEKERREIMERVEHFRRLEGNQTTDKSN